MSRNGEGDHEHSAACDLRSLAWGSPSDRRERDWRLLSWLGQGRRHRSDELVLEQRPHLVGRAGAGDGATAVGHHHILDLPWFAEQVLGRAEGQQEREVVRAR